jgi:RNA polymerase sigma factor (sigma-70 family)
MTEALGKRFVRHSAEAWKRERSDARLLETFLSGERAESQIAFRTLVVRHGPMVLGICRHALGHRADAEAAFQAPFLMLARKAASIRNRNILAGWLHEVAYRFVTTARADASRRPAHEPQSSPPPVQSSDHAHPGPEAAWHELQLVWDEEVDRLPKRLRIPVILSYLEGKTDEEVADLLQWSIGKVKRRLARARDALRSRLLRRGMAPSAAFLVMALFRGTVFAEIVPAELVNRTVRAARPFGTRSVTSASTHSPLDRGLHCHRRLDTDELSD